MSAIYNHSIQGGAIHATLFLFCSSKVQVIAFVSGMIFGAIPDLLKGGAMDYNFFGKIIKVRFWDASWGVSAHEGKLDKWFGWIPAWGFHTKIIDNIYHNAYKPKSFVLNWLEVYLTALSIFILITFIKGLL